MRRLTERLKQRGERIVRFLGSGNISIEDRVDVISRPTISRMGGEFEGSGGGEKGRRVTGLRAPGARRGIMATGSRKSGARAPGGGGGVVHIFRTRGTDSKKGAEGGPIGTRNREANSPEGTRKEGSSDSEASNREPEEGGGSHPNANGEERSKRGHRKEPRNRKESRKKHFNRKEGRNRKGHRKEPRNRKESRKSGHRKKHFNRKESRNSNRNHPNKEFRNSKGHRKKHFKRKEPRKSKGHRKKEPRNGNRNHPSKGEDRKHSKHFNNDRKHRKRHRGAEGGSSVTFTPRLAGASGSDGERESERGGGGGGSFSGARDNKHEPGRNKFGGGSEVPGTLRGPTPRPGRRRGGPRIGRVALPRGVAVHRLTRTVGVRPSMVIGGLFVRNVVIAMGRRVSFRGTRRVTLRCSVVTRPRRGMSIVRRLLGRSRRSRGSVISEPPMIYIVKRISRNGASLLSTVHGAGMAHKRTNNVARRVNTSMMRINKRGVAFLSAPKRRTFATVHVHNTGSASVTILIMTTSSNIVPRAMRTVDRTGTTNIRVVITVGGVSGPDTGVRHMGRRLSRCRLVPRS